MNPVKMRLLIHHIGFRSVAKMILYKVVNKVICMKIYNICCLTPQSLNQKMKNYKSKFRHRLLPNEDLGKYLDDKELEWDRSFIDDVSIKGDRVFGMLDDDAVIAYLCFSNKPTHFYGDLAAEFDSSYVYAYKGFTKKAYRGGRLYAEAMVVTVNQFYSQGYVGILSCIEANNYASMRAAQWVGFQTKGRLLVSRIFGKYIIAYDRSCLDFGLKLVPKSKRNDSLTAAKPRRVHLVG